jgi:hypothetical protein
MAEGLRKVGVSLLESPGFMPVVTEKTAEGIQRFKCVKAL